MELKAKPTHKIILLEKNNNYLSAELIKHIYLIQQEDIDKLCQPIKDLGINYFLYIKAFNDGTRTQLTNNLAWSEHFYKNNYYLMGEFDDPQRTYCPGLFLWSTLPCQQIYQDIRNHFSIDHGVTLVEKINDGYEFFHYGAHLNNYKIINFYLNNFDYLKRFNLYFKDRGANLIKLAENLRVQIPTRECAELINLDNFLSLQDSYQNFIAQTPIKRYYLDHIGSDTYLTQREVECLYWLAKGNSSKEIARSLQISERTVEEHLLHIKAKIGCNKNSQLVYLLTKHLPITIDF